MSKADYSKWLTPERLAIEEQLWANPETRTWPFFVEVVRDIMLFTDVKSIVEFGCGTGWVPKGLFADIPGPEYPDYLGIDANFYCIEQARIKNREQSNSQFILGDVRAEALRLLHDDERTFDLVCAFSFMKHFSLDEWDDVVMSIVRCGRWAAFSVPVGPETKDDGTEYPHVWVTKERIAAALAQTNHGIVGMNPLPWGETMVTTCQG